MLNTVSDIIGEVLVRSGVSTSLTTSGGLYTDTILRGWLGDAHVWAAAYKKWPFTEGRLSTTFTTGLGPNTDEWYFDGIKADSIRFIQVGGKRLQKLNFDDYQIMREETPAANDKVYSDFGRTVFINPRADISGTLYAYSQYQPNLDTTDSTATTIFSSYDEEGNEGILQEILSFAKTREKKLDEAEFHHKKAMEHLENVAGRFLDEQFAYHTASVRDGMFKRFDAVNGGITDELFDRDQFR